MNDRSIDPKRALRVNSEVLSRSVEGDLVLYHPQTDAVTHLDAVAALIWSELVAEPTLDELVAAMANRFGGDPAVVRRDILALLEELAQADLVAVA